MAYFKNGNEVFWFDDEQIKNGMSEGMTEINESEKELLTEHTKTTEDIIRDKKEYLYDTDWVVTKITEAQLRGVDISPLLTKYNDVLIKRESTRTEINVLESEV